jgi:hypothetical protein
MSWKTEYAYCSLRDRQSEPMMFVSAIVHRPTSPSFADHPSLSTGWLSWVCLSTAAHLSTVRVINQRQSERIEYEPSCFRAQVYIIFPFSNFPHKYCLRFPKSWPRWRNEFERISLSTIMDWMGQFPGRFWESEAFSLTSSQFWLKKNWDQKWESWAPFTFHEWSDQRDLMTQLWSKGSWSIRKGQRSHLPDWITLTENNWTGTSLSLWILCNSHDSRSMKLTKYGRGTVPTNVS